MGRLHELAAPLSYRPAARLCALSGDQTSWQLVATKVPAGPSHLDQHPHEHVIKRMRPDRDPEAAKLVQQGEVQPGQRAEQEDVTVVVLAVGPDVVGRRED